MSGDGDGDGDDDGDGGWSFDDDGVVKLAIGHGASGDRKGR